MIEERSQFKMLISIVKEVCSASQQIDTETNKKIKEILNEFQEIKHFLENSNDIITLNKEEFSVFKKQIEEIIFMTANLVYTSIALLRNKFNVDENTTFEEFIERVPSPSKFNN